MSDRRPASEHYLWPDWTIHQQAVSLNEGWGLFRRNDGTVLVAASSQHRYVFGSDANAELFVVMRAHDGSAFHMHALNVIKLWRTKS